MDVVMGGIMPLSTIDYEGKSATVIFFGGCNFRCRFCYSHAILDARMCTTMNAQNVYSLVMEGRKLIEAVVFDGGEPTAQPDALVELVKMFKAAGLLVKIDTNGSNVGVLAELLARNLVDYIALDVKAPLDNEREYSHITQRDAKQALHNLTELMRLKGAFNFFLECRTTIVPGLIFRQHDIEGIAKSIGQHADRYVLQQFTPVKGCVDKSYDNVQSPKREELVALAKTAKKHIADVRIRTSEGEEKV
jgi:pyruvate formate lyase activating enzyme